MARAMHTISRLHFLDNRTHAMHDSRHERRKSLPGEVQRPNIQDRRSSQRKTEHAEPNYVG